MQPVTELYQAYKQVSSWRYILVHLLKHSNVVWSASFLTSIILYGIYFIGQLMHFLPTTKYDFFIASILPFFFFITGVSYYWSAFNSLNKFKDISIVVSSGWEQLKCLLWLEKIKKTDCYHLESINDAIKKVEVELPEPNKDSSLKQTSMLLITVLLCMISWKLMDKLNLSMNDIKVIIVCLIGLLVFSIFLHTAINHEKKLLLEFYKTLKRTQSNFMHATTS